MLAGNAAASLPKFNKLPPPCSLRILSFLPGRGNSIRSDCAVLARPWTSSRAGAIQGSPRGAGSKQQLLADLAAGRSTLEALGLRPLASVQRKLSAGNTTIYSELLTFQAAACDQEWRTWTNWSALAPCA